MKILWTTPGRLLPGTQWNGPSLRLPESGGGFTLEEIVRDVIVPSGKPVFSGFQSGHCTPKITLPFGVRCRMDAEKCTLTALEAAVLP